jgi:hypothetical protein
LPSGALFSAHDLSDGWRDAVVQLGGNECAFERTFIDVKALLQIAVARDKSPSGGAKFARADVSKSASWCHSQLKVPAEHQFMCQN